MNQLTKILYPWARNYAKGGPIKRQNLLAGMKTPEQTASETMSVAENTKTQNEIDATEQRLQASRAQKERVQQQLSRKNTEIKSQNENSLHYASTNPLTQQIADLGYINEQNPQTWYRPGYMYQSPYFSPEVQQQAKKDMLNYGFLTIGAINPTIIPYLALEPALDLADAEQNTKDLVNYATFVMPAGVSNLWNNTRNLVSNKSKAVAGKLADKLEQYSNKTKTAQKEIVDETLQSPIINPTNVTPPSDLYYLTGNAISANKYATLLDKNLRMPYIYTTKGKNESDILKKIDRSRSLRLRGAFDSDVFVPKSLVAPYKYEFKNIKDGVNKTIKFKPVKRQSNKFLESLPGVENPNPKDYYRVSFNQLLQSESPAFKQQELRDMIFDQVVMTKNGSNNVAQMGLYYNPRTVKLGNHFWPIGYGNLDKMPLARRIGMNTLLSDVNLFGSIPITTSMGINKYQQLIGQSRDYLNSANATDEDQVAFEFADKMTPESRSNLQKAVNAYIKYDDQTALKQIDSAYKDVPGYNEYRTYLIKRNSYAKGGPLRDKHYNTILTSDQEKLYQNWVNSLPINLRRDYDYDLRGAWLNGDMPDENYHMTDKWKKPWHPTFSTESVYSARGAEGGYWDGDNFIPSRINKFVKNYRYNDAIGQNNFSEGGPINDGPPIDWDYFVGKIDAKSRKYNLENLKYADEWLNKNGYTLPQRQAIIYNMWQESGGDPTAVSADGRFAGLLQWDTAPGNRYSKIKDKSLDGQLQYIYDTTYGNMAFNGQNWMGMTRDETRANQAKFKNAKTTEEAMDIFTNGYVRPNKEVRINRMQNYKYYFPENNDTPLVTKPWARLGSGAGASFASGGTIHIKPENRGKFTAAAQRAGKSVQEYARQILANKDHYSSTLVKRANFAHVFGKK